MRRCAGRSSQLPLILMSVSPDSSSPADSSTSVALTGRLWTVVEPILYYVLVAFDGFVGLSRRTRIALCTMAVLLVAGGVMLQAATHEPVSPSPESNLPVGDRDASAIRTDALTAGQATGTTPNGRSVELPSASDGVFLTLRRNVRAPGTRAYAGGLLPAGTITVVYQEPGNEPHTLTNQGFAAHDELMTQIIRAHTGAASPHRKGSVFVDTLTGLGQTRSPYVRTGTPTTNPPRYSAITYVAAKIPNGEMYQSYVNTGEDGFYVGFDAVMSGRMAMGPVADEHAPAMRKMFEVLSVPSVNLPDLAGAVVQAMNSSGFPVLPDQARKSSGNVGASTSSPTSQSANPEESSAASQPSEPVVAATSSSSDEPAISHNLDRGLYEGSGNEQETPQAVPGDVTGQDRTVELPTESVEVFFSTLIEDPSPVSISEENAETPEEIQPATGTQSSASEASEREASASATPATEAASTGSASGVSGWWVVVALLGGMAAGGAGGYVYWGRKVEVEQARLARLRVAFREEQAARKVQSASGLVAGTSAGTVAPEFELGDDFWESSTVKPPPTVNEEETVSDRAEGDEWLDNLPF